MSHFQGFDNQNNEAKTAGLLTGIVLGSVTFLLGVREWWSWGWGPGNWSRSDILHAYWLAFWGNLNPSYVGDLGSWGNLKSWLLDHHAFDSFVASFWVPVIVGATIGILTAWFVIRAINKQKKGYIRGSRIIR